jgi:branched-chain amino acid transport system substrate-binding protein
MKTTSISWIGLAIIAGIGAILVSRAALPSQNGYTIGVMVPLTGASASIGENVRDGVELAIKDITAEGGSVRLLIEDDKGDSPTAVSIAHKFIDTEGVHVMLGPVKSDPLLAIAPITEKDKVIILSPTAGAASITNAGDFVFRNIEAPAIHGRYDADFFIKHGAETVAVLTANASNAQSYSSAFTASYESIGRIVTTSSYDQNATDFRAIIAKALAAKPRGIYIGVATAKDAGLIVKQARELGYNGPIMLSIAADTKAFLDVAGASAEGAYVSASYFDRSKYPLITSSFEANAYDATMLLYAAMKQCGSDSKTECIRDYLYATKDYPGLGGSTTFDANGDVVKPVMIEVVRKGSFVPVE